MKKIILVLTALALAATPVMAGKKNHNNGNNDWNTETYNYNYTYKYKYKYDNGNDDAWIAGVGGLLGGLLLGGALANPGPRYYDGPTPQEYCGTRWETRWNAVYQQWEKIPHTVCWVQ